MKVVIDSIEISGTNRYGRMEAEVEFNENSEVIKEFGVKEILAALDSGDFLNEIGWEEVKKYFADEVQEERDEAFEEGKKAQDED